MLAGVRGRPPHLLLIPAVALLELLDAQKVGLALVVRELVHDAHKEQHADEAEDEGADHVDREAHEAEPQRDAVADVDRE